MELQKLKMLCLKGRDRSGPRLCDFGADFSKMAQRKNCMGSLWRIEIKFGADCQVHRVK